MINIELISKDLSSSTRKHLNRDSTALLCAVIEAEARDRQTEAIKEQTKAINNFTKKYISR